MFILIYIFNSNQKIIGANDEEKDFLDNKIEYKLVKDLENIKTDIHTQNNKKYVEDYGIITENNECRIQNRNRNFDDHTILEKEYLVPLLENISIEHLDIDTMIDDHMTEHDEETCKIR